MSEYIVDGAVPNHTVRVEDEREVYWHMTHLPVREEIVRCRDCKFYTPESMTREERGFGVYENVWEPGGCFNPERCPHGGDPFGEWYVIGINTDPDGFCAWGERRVDG